MSVGHLLRRGLANAFGATVLNCWSSFWRRWSLSLSGVGWLGGLRCRAGDGFAHQVDGVLQPLVEFGQLGILRQFLMQGGGLLVRQLAQQQGGQAGLQLGACGLWGSPGS